MASPPFETQQAKETINGTALRAVKREGRQIVYRRSRKTAESFDFPNGFIT